MFTACQAGEEQYLEAAARLLDNEAATLSAQIGRLPESRMLLMAGLMVADRTAGLEETQKKLKERVAALESELAALRAAPKPNPETIEVAVIPSSVTDTLAEIAARAEALADQAEESLGQV